MSQKPVKTIVVQPAPTNALGVAGFVISLVGLLTCGLICPLGLLLSFVGVFKPPRGLAIAGTVIGLLGSFWLVLFGLGLVIGLLGLGTSVDEALREADQRLQEGAVKWDQQTEPPTFPGVEPPEIEPPELGELQEDPNRPGGLILEQEDFDRRVKEAETNLDNGVP